MLLLTAVAVTCFYLSHERPNCNNFQYVGQYVYIEIFWKQIYLALHLAEMDPDANATTLDSCDGGAFVRKQAQRESDCGIRQTNRYRYQHSFRSTKDHNPY
jgi:hypothetical protein